MADRILSQADGRANAPAANPAEIKARNQAALEARKQKLKALESAELPAGWRKVESRSRPGEFVYENIHTEERQAWFPDAPAQEVVAAPLVAQSEDEKKKAEMIARNKAALAKRNAEQAKLKAAESSLTLPDGWVRVESRSRPGEFVYENKITGDRQAWFPDAPAVAPAASDDAKKAAIEKNKAALEKRKAALAQKSADADRPLPEGWARVESRSRPGEFVYENKYTEERQAWFPETPAEKPLPAGWRKVESRSYPGEFVYENIYTEERQAWVPDAPASKEEGASPAKAPAKKATRPEVCKAKAVYDYTAVNREEEIDLLEGDTISVEYKAANGWWVGTNLRTQKSGIFPGTYVE